MLIFSKNSFVRKKTQNEPRQEGTFDFNRNCLKLGLNLAGFAAL